MSSPEEELKIIKEKRKQSNNKYYQKNKDKIISKLCEKELCMACGRMITKSYMEKHIKGKRCHKLAEKLNDEMNRVMQIMSKDKPNDNKYTLILLNTFKKELMEGNNYSESEHLNKDTTP